MSEISNMLGEYYRSPRYVPAKVPKGWEAGFTTKGDMTEVTSVPMENREHDHAELLTDWGYDPKEYFLDNLTFKTWQAQTPDGVEWLRSYRANILRGQKGLTFDVEELREDLRSYIAAPNQWHFETTVVDDALVIALADWQIGKGEAGGTERTVQRIKALIPQVITRIFQLREAGAQIRYLYVMCMGDLVEGCDGHYAQQAFQADLTRRDQIKITTMLLKKFIAELAPEFEKVVVAVVGGNHGENRRKGKSFTSDGDNDDVLVVENVKMIFDDIPELDHVSFVIPDDDLVLTLDVAGVKFSFTHGHLAPGGKDGVEKWWRDLEWGGQPSAGSTICMNGHKHHFKCEVLGAKSIIQCPALDNGSKWFRDMKGQDSPCGLLTFRVTTESPFGWDDLKILSADCPTQD